MLIEVETAYTHFGGANNFSILKCRAIPIEFNYITRPRGIETFGGQFVLWWSVRTVPFNPKNVSVGSRIDKVKGTRSPSRWPITPAGIYYIVVTRLDHRIWDLTPGNLFVFVTCKPSKWEEGDIHRIQTCLPLVWNFPYDTEAFSILIVRVLLWFMILKATHRSYVVTRLADILY